MRVIIVGCGRVGARVAAELDERGENVTVIDVIQRAFNRLPQGFGGETVRGNGTDEDIMRSAGAEQADIVMALTEGDNRNALAAQLAKHTFGVPRVIVKINDPVRAEAYRTLGLETICRTLMLGDALVTAAMEGAEATNGFVEAPTAEPLRGAPVPGSLADAEARAAMAADVDATARSVEPTADEPSGKVLPQGGVEGGM
ncbi:MAG TPA: TrkA family potassium uptake protein [Candidatus Limnocylindria bacterium]|nr:TrkA family potassium uptake protein [Candidatus Limnocylindria bacterium]